MSPTYINVPQAGHACPWIDAPSNPSTESDSFDLRDDGQPVLREMIIERERVPDHLSIHPSRARRDTHMWHMCRASVLGTFMANVTITVPEELKREMKRKKTNWSLVARKAFEEALRQEEMAEAVEGIDRLRTSRKTPGWSGAREITTPLPCRRSRFSRR